MRKLILIALFLLMPLSGHAQQTVFIPSCAGSNDTVKLSAAVSSVGANNATIKLPYKAGSRCAVDNLTIPANITLDGVDGTGIKVNTGQTLTVLGPIINPPGKQLFYNALAGQGTVSFAGNTSVGEFYPPWWGAKGDSATDSAAAIKAANAALITANGGELVFPKTSGEYWVSSATTIKSATTVKCGAMNYPGRPFGNAGQPAGSCTIRLTAAGASGASPASIFFVGEHTTNVKFTDITLVADSKTHTRGVRMFGRKPSSSFNFTFQNVFFKGFDRGISAEDDSGGTAETTHWQVDNVKVDRCDFNDNFYGIWSNTANATNWNIVSTKFDTPDAGYCVWLEQGTFWHFLECQFIGFNVHPVAAVYLGVNPGGILFQGCVIEGPDLFLDTEDNPIGSTSTPIVFVSNFITFIRLRHSRHLVMFGNTFNEVNGVTNNANAGDTAIYAIGNSIRGPGASISQQSGSPFGALTGGGLCITEINSYNSRICTSQAGGLTSLGNLGIGNATPTQTASNRAQLNISKTFAQEIASVPSIQLNGSSPWANYNFLRNFTTGDLMTLGTQAGATGFWFNGPLKGSGINYLAVSGVADAVTTASDATVTSATAAFTTAMVGAQVILSDDTHTHITTIASRTSATEVELTAAPSFTATGVRLMIAYATGVYDLPITGPPVAGECTLSTLGSRRSRTDNATGPALYVCEGVAGVATWVGK